jgi:hypothetical protein
MSWLGVFISSFVPVVLLSVLLIMNWFHGEPRSKHVAKPNNATL